MYYDCPICGFSIPVKVPSPQALGLVRANHLRKHGIYTSRLTVKQKNDPDFIKSLWHTRIRQAFKEATK